jgi:Arc/MetJ-type ribon-helix-helix transcriptional regulator
MIMDDKVSIKIPKDLYLKLEKKIRDTVFEDVDSYIHFILNEILEESVYTKEEEEEIKERLRNLGYI